MKDRNDASEMTNTPCQWLACRALQRTDEIIAQNRALIAANLEHLERFVEARSSMLRLLHPKAGTMAIVEQRTSLTSTAFCERVLAEDRLFVIPGRFLGMSDRLLRFGLGRKDFAAALERLDQFLIRLKKLGEAT